MDMRIGMALIDRLKIQDNWQTLPAFWAFLAFFYRTIRALDTSRVVRN